MINARNLPFGVVAAIVLGLVAIAPSPASATAPSVTDGGVQNNFPDGMVFSVHAEGESITNVRLQYKILPDGTSASARPDFTPGNSVDASLTLGNPNTLYLPPGTVIEYHWEVTDDTGAKTVTDGQSFFYDDIRFDWRNVDGDGMTIYYYSGSEGDASDMHAVADKAISDAEILLGTTVPFDVQVRVYDSRDDMSPALQRISAGFESKIIVEGVRVATNTVLVLGNASFDTLRHELTHVVTAQAAERGGFGHMPSWLDEGTAVHAQQDRGGYADAIEEAIDRGNVLSVREITVPTGNASKVNLFYGEAGSLVSYLVDTYGEAKFAQLFADIKAGKGVDKSFEAVYGFDQDGLDNAWREVNGLSPRATPAPPTEAPSRTTVPTLAPVKSESGGGTSTGTLIAIAAAVIVLAGVVGAGGITLARKL